MIKLSIFNYSILCSVYCPYNNELNKTSSVAHLQDFSNGALNHRSVAVAATRDCNRTVPSTLCDGQITFQQRQWIPLRLPVSLADGSMHGDTFKRRQYVLLMTSTTMPTQQWIRDTTLCINSYTNVTLILNVQCFGISPFDRSIFRIIAFDIFLEAFIVIAKTFLYID